MLLREAVGNQWRTVDRLITVLRTPSVRLSHTAVSKLWMATQSTNSAPQASIGTDKPSTSSSHMQLLVNPKDLEGSIAAYMEFRKQAVDGQGRALCPLQQSDLRRFHLKLRSTAKRASADTVHAVSQAIVQVIEDMHALEMRIGATEISAHIYALHQLGRHHQAIKEWQSYFSRCYQSKGTELHHITHMFPQTHIYALDSAVALKNAHAVRNVYYQSMRAMETSYGCLAHQRIKTSKMCTLLFWSIFPTSANQSRKRSCGTQNVAVVTEHGTDKQWDAARLGSKFLANMYRDVNKWADTDSKPLLSRIMQFLIRALFVENKVDGALKLYKHMLDGSMGSPDTGTVTVPKMTSWILCEMVGGLCRRMMLHQAHKTLVEAKPEYRNSYVWNTYLNGIVESATAMSKTMRRQMFGLKGPLEFLQLAIHEMEGVDQIHADRVTRSIWLRACFCFDDWRSGEKYFRSNYSEMLNDYVCWDIVIRGLFKADEKQAQEAGWQLVDELVRIADSQMLAIDERLIETVLRHLLWYLSSYYEPAFVPDNSLVQQIMAWIETRLPQVRQNTLALVIGSLLSAGNVDSALELHRAMIRCSLWPSKSVNCMVAKAIASQGTSQSIEKAAHFIDNVLPRQHYTSAYNELLKVAIQRQNYTDVWFIIYKYYPQVAVAATADSPEYWAPYPNAVMYAKALQMTKEHGDQHQHRLLLDRMQRHLEVVAEKSPTIALRMSKIYGAFRNAQQI
ncbi:hypothetical protein BX667DRAFT_516109 [Coemansia mojavensis]|nr:hypothetical protein BX667DRAFT_516109 [Coemansia mojavensis]